MNIYTDENIERPIIEGLRRRGIDVISVVDLGYAGSPDTFHIKKASEVNAVILTRDADFLRMAHGSGVQHNGIIFAHSKNTSIGQCIRGVELIANILTAEDMKNHIEFL